MPRRSATPRPLTGTVEAPGDKSMSHRALILASLARGRSRIEGANLGQDVHATASALNALGANCGVEEGMSTVEVEGCGWDGLREPEGVIDAGNSGTTLRLLMGICATIPGLSVLTGDATLRRRPMLRVAAPLRQMGAAVDGRRHGDLAPIAVRGGRLTGIDVELPVASAQVKSALLLAGLRAEGATVVVEPGDSRDHTERMLEALGAPITRGLRRAEVGPGWSPEPFRYRVPGDISSALFLVGAAALVPGSRLTVESVGLNPTRSAALDVMARMGARLVVREEGESLGEPVGSVEVEAGPLHGTSIDEAEVPRLIDEVPILAVVATQAEGVTTIAGADELRVKESDRIAAMAEGLSALGADVAARPDGLIVRGPTPLHGGVVESHGDHRVALALAVAGLVASSTVTVRGWSSINTSFPEFLDLLGHAQGKS